MTMGIYAGREGLEVFPPPLVYRLVYIPIGRGTKHL